jgi:hypothetical protein
MEAHEIVGQVHEKFKKVCEGLAKLTGLNAETFRSHHREPKSQNPLSSGNASPVTHYMRYCRQNQASEKGAGRMLNRRVYEELEMEFAETELGDNDCSELTQTAMHTGILRESYDVLKCLNEHKFDELSLPELARIEEEGAQLRDAAKDFISHIRALRKQRKER